MNCVKDLDHYLHGTSFSTFTKASLKQEKKCYFLLKLFHEGK